MKRTSVRLFLGIIIFFGGISELEAQTFARTELSANLKSPWEIIYGPDGSLWLTEAGGVVSRVNPEDGTKTVVYTAPDYFGGSAAEQSTLCFKPNIGAGTLGMALHPDFMNGAPYIYYVYSYNSASTSSPSTKFKIERLTWSSTLNAVTANTVIVNQIPSGYDHLGGRLMIIKQNNLPYLFLTVGDHGISETGEPTCYNPQNTNPNNYVQDINTKDGKVHRFNMDGSIPTDNPIPGNSFYTRGHRNPQGLMYNTDKEVIYAIEHGDRTDDEINILKAGMNYGWKYVRGFHNDNNYSGELNFVNNYIPHPLINGDALQEPLYSWCSVPQTTVSAFLDWCTVAPSDGVYYGSKGIKEWTNSLLVVTLKNGSSTDMEVYRFKLNPDGRTLATSTVKEPNPKKFFGADQASNGRLRDIAISPDGTKIYLINNGGAPREKITVYTCTSCTDSANPVPNEFEINLFPNPSNEDLVLECSENMQKIRIVNCIGQLVREIESNTSKIKLEDLGSGLYLISVQTVSGRKVTKRWIKL